MPASWDKFTDLMNVHFVELSDQILMCFFRNHFGAKHEYMVSCVDTFYNGQLQNDQPNRSHTNGAHGSRGPTLKRIHKRLPKKQEPNFLQGI